MSLPRFRQLRGWLRVGRIAVLSLMVLHTSQLQADSWPMAAHDAHRSNATAENLEYPLRLQWRYTAVQKPQPAWPEPVKNLNRLDFDYAPQPVVADGRLYFGSSADDTVRALDAATGRHLWQYTAGGPVRFAPQVVGNALYLGADDGVVVCLDASTGKKKWSFQAAPYNEQLLGNGRMISRWPLRSGVLVEQGVVYFTAGMWSAEGIYVYALKAEDGKLIWCNDTSGTMGLMGAHATFSLTGVNPQGYLLAKGDKLLVPTGRTSPAGYDRRTGKFLYYDPGFKTNGFGGSWVTIDGDNFYAFTKNFYSALGLSAGSLESGKKLAGRVGRMPQHSTFVRSKQYSLYDGKTSVVVHDGKIHARKSYGLIFSGDALLVGGDGSIHAEDAATGKLLWKSEVQGQARGIAVADGQLYVTTDAGEIYGFAASGKGSLKKVIHHQPAKMLAEKPQVPTTIEPRMLTELRSSGMDRGYALVVGDRDARLSRVLTNQTELHVVNVQPTRSETEKLRRELVSTTSLYGSRIAVLTASDTLPFAKYFANTVIVADAPGQVSLDHLYRVLRPCGGRLFLLGENADKARTLLEAANIPAEEIKADAQSVRVVRGRLPGALDWDSEARTDRNVRWPLRPLWYGGPGPAKMNSRKFRSQTLGFADGRYFVMGEGHLLAIDAYNGTQLWSRPIESVKTMAADDRHLYLTLAVGKDAPPSAPAGLQLDVRSGKTLQQFDRSTIDQIPEPMRGWARTSYDPAVMFAPRLHPLTARSMPKVWLKTFGCSGISASATSVFTRSGTLGTYDFSDDSGMRNFGGLRPSCGQSTMAALGLWIVNEGSSSCECSYSYQTSLAFAPAERRLAEDWAVFYDWDVDSVIRRAAINLGAPGDRRDRQKDLWLGYPRPTTEERFLPKRPGSASWLNIPGVPQQKMPVALQIPLEVECSEALGHYRFNADRTPVAGTDRPWIYASGYRGIRKATLRLNFLQPVIAAKASASPKLDGELSDHEWSAEPGAILADSKTKVYFQFDETHLYVASVRPPLIDRKGQVAAWNKRGTGDDFDVWRSDSWELFFSDEGSGKVLQLALGASGARYDALSSDSKVANKRFNTVWKSAVIADEKGFVTEMAIPWSSLEEAGLSKSTLSVNFQINRSHNLGEALMYLGFKGRTQCENFTPLGLGRAPKFFPRDYTVDLHFAEPDQVKPGTRVFDVIVQGRKVIEGLDVVSEAGASRTALVRSFAGISALDTLTVEFKPHTDASSPTSVPILSGIQIRDESLSLGPKSEP